MIEYILITKSCFPSSYMFFNTSSNIFQILLFFFGVMFRIVRPYVYFRCEWNWLHIPEYLWYISTKLWNRTWQVQQVSTKSFLWFCFINFIFTRFTDFLGHSVYWWVKESVFITYMYTDRGDCYMFLFGNVSRGFFPDPPQIKSYISHK